MLLPTDQPIGDAQPIMLRDAARLMFPDGSVNEKTLRRMRDQGKLDCSRIRGRDYTTLAAMRVMLERTRVEPKARQRIEVKRPEVAGSDPSIALAAALARCRVREPTKPREKQARKPLPEAPKPRTRKRQLSPRPVKIPASDP